MSVGKAYTATVSIDGTSYTGSASFTPAICMPNGDLVSAGTEICEDIIISVPTLNDDTDPALD